MASNLLSLLAELESCLKAAGLWQRQEIDPLALTSTQPFCCDTMSFEQWLQFVFIPKMQLLIRQSEPLPKSMAIAPMAEMTLQNHRYFSVVYQSLKNIDAAFEQRSSC
ncbi:YqcC family protein [Pseudoalteromonas sp. T1lg65]|uniref:YqcC family protein n=1 Tax=Pseudoalteromonas sp. T1lg65 TaxID=2077101 RepID=UPI003F79C2CF